MPAKQKPPVYVLGVGMTKFIKPRKVDLHATRLRSPHQGPPSTPTSTNYDSVERARHRMLLLLLRRQHPQPTPPLNNVNNNNYYYYYSTGSTGLAMARNLIASSSSVANCIMPVGRPRESPGDTTVSIVAETQGSVCLSVCLSVLRLMKGAAAILVSQAFLDARPEIASRAYAVEIEIEIEIAGQCLAMDGPSLFSRSAIDLLGYEMTQFAVRAATYG
ncbi:hypothetical protein E4U59_007936 [Claviceps monticola]|nr:hypothetical protein E4U59_007936 [Claviceps monticola]